MSNNTKDPKVEIREIREAFQASRPQFGAVFLGGKTKATVWAYETGKIKIPNDVMMLARAWKIYLDDMHGKGKDNEKVQD